MKKSKIRVRFLGGLLVLALVLSQASAVAIEQTFDALQIGTHTYRNVTVTTKSKDYVFILHSAGMTNIKVAELTPELREKLGYEELPKPKPAATNATAWAKQTINKLETPQVKAMEEQVVSTWRDKIQVQQIKLPALTRTILYEALGIFAAIYLFYCYCCMLICQKAGQTPGFLVWLPVLQVFPLLRAAGMSRWWFLTLLAPLAAGLLCLPGLGISPFDGPTGMSAAWLISPLATLLNLVRYAFWCVKIVKARNKSIFVSLFLFLPVINILAFLYLAFSGGPERKSADGRIPILRFEAA